MPEKRFVGRGDLPEDPTRKVDDPLKDPAGYSASDELANAVNVALSLRMPLLVTGDPGTGKTQLAFRIAAELGFGKVLRFDTKSSSVATELFYQFDSVRQFTQSQLNAATQRRLPQATDFVRWHAMGLAILRTLPPDSSDLARLGDSHPRHDAPMRSLVLIDEIDKAPRDFPNDLLNQMENYEFFVPELQMHFAASRNAQLAPVVLITSNSERQLPEAFLRRCVYHHIEFPKDAHELHHLLEPRLKAIQLAEVATRDAVQRFFRLREDRGFSRAPSTSELLDWLRALRSEGFFESGAQARQKEVLLATAGTLFKTREDLSRALDLHFAA